MKAAKFDYARPADCAEAALLLQQSGGMGKLLGGGQSLGPMMNLRLASDEIKELSRSLREEPSRLLFSDPPPEREGIK